MYSKRNEFNDVEHSLRAHKFQTDRRKTMGKIMYRSFAQLTVLYNLAPNSHFHGINMCVNVSGSILAHFL